MGYLKFKVYFNKPNNLYVLRQRIGVDDLKQSVQSVYIRIG